MLTKRKEPEAITKTGEYELESIRYDSAFLDRVVNVDIYNPFRYFPSGNVSLLLVNDGQDLRQMSFINILTSLLHNQTISPLLVVAMHCNEDRRLEYGTADVLDYMNRGARARYHRKFILRELLPFMQSRIHPFAFNDSGIAGFSLGGLSAMDIGWANQEIFNRIGVFSGSFWWRKKALEDGYIEEKDRIMHELIKAGTYHGKQQYFLQTGLLDEKMDRNHNGIIDSVDDTLDIIKALKETGVNSARNIKYLELEDGRHDVATWARAWPEFLKWGWPASAMLD